MKIAFFVVAILVAVKNNAQELPPRQLEQLENLASATETETQEDDAALQLLTHLRKHPLSINTVSSEALAATGLLTAIQVDHFIKYRALFGKLIDLYELQAVPSWDIATIKKILPYLTLQERIDARSILSRFNGEQSILFRLTRVLQKAKGYDRSLPNHYLGDRNHLLLRYRYQYKDLLYFGIVADKDPGEEFFRGVQSEGFDFYSFHFFARKLGIIKALAIGDYSLNLGQGLLQWQSPGLGKSSDVMMIKRQSAVLLPYRSPSEFYFNRGIALTMQLKKIELTLFASHKKIGGNILSDTADGFSSINVSGLYRTASEAADKRKIKYACYGSAVNYRTGTFKIGLNLISHHFDKRLEKNLQPYAYFNFSGTALQNASMDYSYTFRNIHLFGEAAVDDKRHTAFLSGALVSADPKLALSFLYRHISSRYQSLFANAFTENTLPANEQGFFTGIQLKPVYGWEIEAYADFYRFPWIKYRIDAPGRGYDYLISLAFRPNKQSDIYIRYRNENKPLNIPEGTMNVAASRSRQNLRMQFTTMIRPRFELRSRVEMIWFDRREASAEEGFLGYLEGQYEVSDKVNAVARVQFFQTDGYNSRLYAYESDVPYSLSLPAFFNKGARCYLNLAFAPAKKIRLWFRWVQSFSDGNEPLGSGLDELPGATRSELKFQIEYKF